MTESRQLALFDYGTLDLDTRSFVQTKTAEIRILIKQTAQGIIEIGQRLIEVKERLGYGNFDSWVKGEFDWSRSTAYRFISVAESCPTVGQLDFSPKALYLLAAPSTPESAREEALTLAESGERVTYHKAQELVAKHKSELEATKKAAQQTITTLEEQIKALENERSRLRAENNRAILTKQADDACIIRQEEAFEKLTHQLEELKAKAAQPQVIEKEVEKIVEIEVVKTPDDYEQLKAEVAALKEKLKTSRQKAGEELSHYQQRVDNLTKRLAQKEEALASFDMEQKQMKALRKVSEGENCILEAMRLLEGSYLSQPGLQETIIRYIESIRNILDRFADQAGVIDSEVVYDSACTK